MCWFRNTYTQTPQISRNGILPKMEKGGFELKQVEGGGNGNG